MSLPFIIGSAVVGGALSANVCTRSWGGSLVPYLESDKTAFEPLSSGLRIFPVPSYQDSLNYSTPPGFLQKYWLEAQ